VLNYGTEQTMPKKSSEVEHKPAARDTDTARYEQLHGAQDPKTRPNRRSEKMPHERDESAVSTGNRLDEAAPPSDRQISQALDDVEEGRLDTERKGVPSDVPRGGSR
jgi:hypothetical protein